MPSLGKSHLLTLALGNVISFEVNLYGGYYGDPINTCAAYEAFVSKLDQWFFDHLENVRTFDLSADFNSPLGLTGLHHRPLTLSGKHMPLLQYLELRNIFLCAELINFIVDHRDTLVSVRLVHCYCSTSTAALAINGVYWDALFEALLNVNPRRLRHFEIVDSELSFMDEQFGLTDEEELEIEAARRIMKDNPHRRLFAYGILDDADGTLLDDEDEIRARFLQGDDEKSYSDLMRLVGENRLRREESKGKKKLLTHRSNIFCLS